MTGRSQMGTKLANIPMGKFDFDLHKIGLHRKTLMGLAALSIFIMHFTAIGALQFIGPLVLVGKALAAWTAVDVEIFCLVSGYGIFYSLSKRPPLIHYFEKRLERVVIPFLLIMVPGNLFLLCLPLNECLFRCSTLYYWLEKNDGTWFVLFIILMYALAPLFFRMYSSGTHSQIIGWHCIFMAALWGGIYAVTKLYPMADERWGLALYRVPMFFTGMLLAAIEKNGKGTIPWTTNLVLFIVCLLKSGLNIDFGVFEALLLQCRSMICICFECLILDVASRYTRKGFYIMDSVGKCSLEFYLVHGLILNWLRKDPVRMQNIQGNFCAVLLMLAVTYAVSLEVNGFSNVIIRVLTENTHRKHTRQ